MEGLMACRFSTADTGCCLTPKARGAAFCSQHVKYRWQNRFTLGETSRCCLVDTCKEVLDPSKATTPLSSSLCLFHQEDSGLGTASNPAYLLYYLSACGLYETVTKKTKRRRP
jgi:hypothetical protein